MATKADMKWGIWCLDPAVDGWVEGEGRTPCTYPTRKAALADLDDWCMKHMRQHYEVRKFDA